jgi:signal transduction histidine kinase
VTTATATARVARVQRKLDRFDAALATYDHLAAMTAATVDRLPAALVARVGRASVLETRGDDGCLRDEAAHLRDDLLSGRWPLSRAEFEYYSQQVASWSGTPVVPRVEDLVASEAVEWAWEELRTAREPGWQAIRLPAGAAIVAWSPAGDGARAVVADGRYLSRVAGTALPNLPWVVRDARGETLAGDPRAATAATAASARVLGDASGGEWTLHLATPEPSAAATPRRRLLLSTVALAGLVLAAGWYFVLGGMARERMAGRAQADFVSAVSHEFRSPLTSMSHVAEMLADGRVPEESRARAYDVLVRDTDRLRALVEQLLEFGRFEAGTFALRIDRLDLADTVRHTVSDFQARVARDGCRVEVTAPDGPVWIDADREALGLALWNLLDNAVKYSPDAPAVWVTLRQDGEQVRIDVRDEGIGIPADEQVEVFRQFVRGAEAKSRHIRGTGVGLALVRHVARAHGGDVTVDSAPGRGSTFTMSLPARNVDDSAARVATKEDVT